MQGGSLEHLLISQLVAEKSWRSTCHTRTLQSGLEEFHVDTAKTRMREFFSQSTVVPLRQLHTREQLLVKEYSCNMRCRQVSPKVDSEEVVGSTHLSLSLGFWDVGLKWARCVSKLVIILTESHWQTDQLIQSFVALVRSHPLTNLIGMCTLSG